MMRSILVIIAGVLGFVAGTWIALLSVLGSTSTFAIASVFYWEFIGYLTDAGFPLIIGAPPLAAAGVFF